MKSFPAEPIKPLASNHLGTFIAGGALSGDIYLWEVSFLFRHPFFFQWSGFLINEWDHIRSGFLAYGWDYILYPYLSGMKYDLNMY